MPGPNTITVAQLSRRDGLPDAFALPDIRIEKGGAADPRVVPGAVGRDWPAVSTWADDDRGRTVAVIYHRGLKLSEGVASWLHYVGPKAEHVGGGFVAWSKAGAPPVLPDYVPVADRLALIACYRWPSDAVSEAHYSPSASPVP